MIDFDSAIRQIETSIHYRDFLFAARRHESRIFSFQLKKIRHSVSPRPVPYWGTAITYYVFDLEMQSLTGQDGFWRVSCNVHGNILATFDSEHAADFAMIHDRFGH